MVWVVVSALTAGLLGVAGRMVVTDMKTQRTQRLEGWERIAGELGLQYVGGNNPSNQGMLAGTIEGHRIRVEADTVENLSMLNFSVQFARVEGPPFSLTRRPSGIPARLRDDPLRYLGKPETPPERTFDQAITIAASDETALSTFLTPLRRDAVAELFASTRDPKTQVTNSDIRTSVARDDVRFISPMVSLLVETANALGPPQDREPPQDQRSV